MKTKTPKKTETIWVSDWKLGGFVDSRVGIELNRTGKTILVWTQTRRYLLSPVVKKEMKKYLTDDQFDRLFKRRLDFDLFAEEGPPTSEEMVQHMNLGPKALGIREYLRLHETNRRSVLQPDSQARLNQLVADEIAWLKYAVPQLTLAVSFKKKLPAMYVFTREKKKRKAMVQNRTWNAEGMIRSHVTSMADNVKEEDIVKHLCTAATSLLGRECHDMTDILRPTIRERLAPYLGFETLRPRLKMEWYPQFLRPMFTHESFIEGVAKVCGTRGKKTRQLVAQLVADMSPTDMSKVGERTTRNQLFFAYLGRRMVSAEEIQKILLSNHKKRDGHYGSCHTKIAIRDRKQLKLVPSSHRAGWLSTFKDAEYCTDTLNSLGNILSAGIELDWQEVPKDGNEAHDYLARTLVKKRKEGMYKYVLEITEKFKQLHGAVVDLDGLQARFRLPENKGEIFEWGETQHHCIATYADGHAAGEHVLLEVAVGDEKYHMMLKQKSIIQFYGKYNKTPPENVEQAVRKYLEQQKFIRPES